jgi:hypothetical protein
MRVTRGLPRVASVLVISALGACGSDEPSTAGGGTPAEATHAGDDATAIAPAGAVASCAGSATDEVAAERMAKACGRRVEVEAGRTEYNEVYVEPSGLRTIETAIAPQRARRRDGAWGPIDTALQRVGDVLVPVATAADVRFSAGGAGPFVTLIRDGHSFALSWPAPLPAPTVSGDSATYADVLPDVDLVVRATATGFAHLLVVKTARAAANPGVRRASYRISGDATLKETPGGGLIADRVRGSADHVGHRRDRSRATARAARGSLRGRWRARDKRPGRQRDRAWTPRAHPGSRDADRSGRAIPAGDRSAVRRRPEPVGLCDGG